MVAHDRCGLVGNDAGQHRQVARAFVRGVRYLAHGLLALARCRGRRGLGAPWALSQRGAGAASSPGGRSLSVLRSYHGRALYHVAADFLCMRVLTLRKAWIFAIGAFVAGFALTALFGWNWSWLAHAGAAIPAGAVWLLWKDLQGLLTASSRQMVAQFFDPLSTNELVTSIVGRDATQEARARAQEVIGAIGEQARPKFDAAIATFVERF